MDNDTGLEKSIRVRILGREYALRVRAEDEELTRDVAAYVDAKMQMFQQAHAGQSELTAAVITALAVAEELYSTWEEQDAEIDELGDELGALADRLAGALGTPEAPLDGRSEA